jgi:hypothetical protein
MFTPSCQATMGGGSLPAVLEYLSLSAPQAEVEESILDLEKTHVPS